MDPAWKMQKRPSSPQGHCSWLCCLRGSLYWRLKFSIYHQIRSHFSFPNSTTILSHPWVMHPNFWHARWHGDLALLAGPSVRGLRAAPPVLLQRRSPCGCMGTGREAAFGLQLPSTACLAPWSRHGGEVASGPPASALAPGLCRLEALWVRP